MGAARMMQGLRISLAAASLVLFAVRVAADPIQGAEPWSFEKVHLKSGKVLLGLIEKESEQGLQFAYVLRGPGKPTLVVRCRIPRDEYTEVERLGIEDRLRLE